MNPFRRIAEFLARWTRGRGRAGDPGSAPPQTPPPAAPTTVVAEPPLVPPAAPAGAAALPRRERRRLERQGRRAGSYDYRGPLLEEPWVAGQLQELRAAMTGHYRLDGALRGAQAAELGARNVLVDATNEDARVQQRTEPRLQAAAGIAANDPDERQRTRWTSGVNAQQERTEAQQVLDQAQRAHVEAQRHLNTAYNQMIDQLLVMAARGIVPINVYLVAYNQARVGRGEESLGILGDETIEQLVHDAVRFVNPNPEAAPAPGDQDEGGEPGLRVA